MKKISLPLLLCASVGAIAVIASQAKMNRASASVNPYVVVEDNFNDRSFAGKVNNKKWQASASSGIVQSSESFCYLSNNTPSGNAESNAFITSKKVTGIKSVTFDVWYSEEAKNSSKWFSPYFVDAQEDIFTSDVAYSGLTRSTYNAAFSGGCSSFSKPNFVFEDILGNNLVDNWVSFQYVITSNNGGYFNAALQGEEFVETNKIEFTYEVGNVDLQNCYFGVSVSNEAGEIRFDNFKIENAGYTLEEEFSSCDPTNPDSDFIYLVSQRLSGDLSYNKFTCVDNATLTFKDAAPGDFIYSKAVLEDNTNGVEEIDLLKVNFNAKITKSNYKIALVFGYDPSVGSLTKNTVVYEMSRYSGVLKQYDENGNQTLDTSKNTNSFIALASEAKIEISLNKKYGFIVKENDKKVQKSGKVVEFSKVSNVLGNVAIACLEKGTDADFECYIDQLKVETNTYYVPVTKSVTHNFSNNFFGNEGFEDFYIRNPEGTGKIQAKDGRLVFERASDGSFFGSAHQYDDFILDFKLCSIYGDPTVNNSSSLTAKDKWIGLDCSRKRVDVSTYGTYANIITNITPDLSNEYSWTAIYTDDYSELDASSVQTKRFNNLPASLFRAITYSTMDAKNLIKPEDAVCFRYVSEGGNISLFVKKASEVTFTKILTYYNLKLNGYFTLSCTGWSFFEIDDFSMANTSPIYTCANNEEPETITKTETEIVYDNQNNDINLDEEIRINSSGCSGSISAPIVILAVSVICLTLVAVRKAKKYE